jgi:photosystem II stability/assembly factor-like uncharacterized protein
MAHANKMVRIAILCISLGYFFFAFIHGVLDISPSYDNGMDQACPGCMWQIVMVSPTEGWAVGNDHFILHFHNQQWTWQAIPSGSLDSIAMISPTEGWAVGLEGSILHYFDGVWHRETNPATGSGSFFTGIAMVPNGEGWIMGKPMLHRFDGVWHIVANAPNLHRVILLDAENGWGVGEQGLSNWFLTCHLINKMMAGSFSGA